MRLTPRNVEGTAKGRTRQYERRGAMILWVGAGLGGLIVLVTSSLASEAPRAFGGVVATLVVVSGAALAWARVNFEWAATTVQRKLDDGDLQSGSELPQELRPWPRFAEFCWKLGRYALAGAALAFVAAVWYAATTIHATPGIKFAPVNNFAPKFSPTITAPPGQTNTSLGCVQYLAALDNLVDDESNVGAHLPGGSLPLDQGAKACGLKNRSEVRAIASYLAQQ
jgi:hypothetical protein